MDEVGELTVAALELSQGYGRKLYSFAVDGKLLHTFSTISRVRQTDDDDIAGYQRPEVLKHVADIRAYLESEDPMLPTNIVIAFDESVVFTPTTSGRRMNGGAVPGVITIPMRNDSRHQRKPGWIVDGQQRVAAIRDAKLQSFPVFVTAFIAASDKEQREQFILVNSPKPLPRDLIYELLPGTESRLPALLQRRRFSASLLRRLNHDEDSPLKAMIRTPTNPKGVIKDNSILRMLENSLSDGALFDFRIAGTPRGDTEGMLQLLKTFWAATATVFRDAWGLPPKASRLMHGAGIISMGLLMDAIVDNHRDEAPPTVGLFCRELECVRSLCHWTEGVWSFHDGRQRKWNELQNTPKDIQMLAMHLLSEYQRCVARSP